MKFFHFIFSNMNFNLFSEFCRGWKGHGSIFGIFFAFKMPTISKHQLIIFLFALSAHLRALPQHEESI